MDMLTAVAVHKHYHHHRAVDGVSFSVPQGSCFGLLGPNGAGKTTLIEVLEDIQPATSGTVLYRGEPRGTTFREEIGIQFQHTSLLNFLSVRETLVSFRGLFSRPAKLEAIIERCNLGPILAQRNNQLSGGQRQRLMLALALINQPELIFLDEPSTGLDPQSRRHLWTIIEDLKAEGKTTILTTHSMEEAEHLCDTIAIMDRGRLIAEGTPESLIAAHCRSSTIILPHQTPTRELASLGLDGRPSRRGLSLTTDDIHETLTRLLSCSQDLTDMSVRSPNLEDVFLHLTGRELRE